MENNEILLEDLCSRLPYGVKLSHKYKNHIHILSGISKGGMIVTTDAVTNEITTTDIENVKPYLFPLSSMTEEQWNDAPIVNLTEFINWLIENRFDINGLIDMGLAIDATGKNIY
jgi:hypothetical protein